MRALLVVLLIIASTAVLAEDRVVTIPTAETETLKATLRATVCVAAAVEKRAGTRMLDDEDLAQFVTDAATAAPCDTLLGNMNQAYQNAFGHDKAAHSFDVFLDNLPRTVRFMLSESTNSEPAAP